MAKDESAVALSPWLTETIQRGDAILFLGAGASVGAIGSNGELAPSGEKLRDILCDKFLGGTLKNKPLAQIAELAKSEAGVTVVQEQIRDLFLPLQPAPFHLLIPSFRWHAIVTTNFDLVVERAYGSYSERQQTLAPIVRDGDNFANRIRDPSQVLYLKLHGCITQVNDENLPLILASEEYAKHRRNRERLFRHFQDWGRERSIIFCGYDVGDPNIQQILFDLADMGMLRPPYALVNPGLDPISARNWASKRFQTSPITFERFLSHIDAIIPKHTRSLGGLRKDNDSTIQPWIKTHAQPTTGLLAHLHNELLHLRKGMPTAGVSPRQFYRGESIEWAAFQQDCDVRRRVSDDIILDAFLDKQKTKAGQLYVLKGYAGSGKSVTLRRVAWDIANLFDGFIFFLKEGGLLRRDLLIELHSLTAERVYVVIEDAIPHVRDLLDVLTWASKTPIPLTFIVGARTNEWNVYARDLETRVDNDYELRDLTEREIIDLVQRLATHNALGRLLNAQRQEQLDHFKLSAERQLLVALHDLTAEKPFEQIVLDEFKNIQPAEARLLYLDVCSLHRLGVGVRAGLVSRVSGITFEYFQRSFFEPLEHVVRTYFDHASRDNMYRSRHRVIADIVFKEALPDPVERAAQIVRIIRNMDVDYESDDLAFREMIRGRVLADLFSNKALAFQIFDAARDSGAPIAFIEHQRAVFELHHPNGNLKAAFAAIEKAESSKDFVDRSILHTKATILRRLALEAPQILERGKLREQAKTLLLKQVGSSRVSHPYHTLGQLVVDELREKLADASGIESETPSEPLQRAIAELVRQAEEMISQGLQRFPGDQFLLTLESNVAQLLKDQRRALDALARALEVSPGRSFVAIRLAWHYAQSGELGKAVETLKRSLAINPSSKDAHFALAKMLMTGDEAGSRDEISYHLKQGFTPGDSNWDAQFWHARHEFIYGNREAAQACFRQLSESWTPIENKKVTRGVVRSISGDKRCYEGTAKLPVESYCFVQCPELNADIFAHISEFDNHDWDRVRNGSLITFELGFTFRGPSAVRCKVAS